MEEVYKANCAALVDKAGGRTGFGVVIRNSAGKVMASCSQVIKGCLNPQAAETCAILRGMQFSIDCGLSPCVVESDAEVVIKWINGKRQFESSYGAILSDIWSLSNDMRGVSFVFARRLSNCVAHILTKKYSPSF